MTETHQRDEIIKSLDGCQSRARRLLFSEATVFEIVVLDRELKDVEPGNLLEEIEYHAALWGCTVQYVAPQPGQLIQHTHLYEIQTVTQLVGTVVYKLNSVKHAYLGRVTISYSDWENDPRLNDPREQERIAFMGLQPEPHKREWFTQLAYSLIRRFEGNEAADLWWKQLGNAPSESQSSAPPEPIKQPDESGHIRAKLLDLGTMRKYHKDFNADTALKILEAIPEAWRTYESQLGGRNSTERWQASFVATQVALHLGTARQYLRAFRKAGITEYQGIEIPGREPKG